MDNLKYFWAHSSLQYLYWDPQKEGNKLYSNGKMASWSSNWLPCPPRDIVGHISQNLFQLDRPYNKFCPKEHGRGICTTILAWPIQIFHMHLPLFPYRLLQQRRCCKLGERQSSQVEGAWVSDDCGKLSTDLKHPHWTLHEREITSEKLHNWVPLSLCQGLSTMPDQE